MGLPHEELTGSVIGAAIRVHKALGPGFLESVYENALAIELQARGIGFERQRAVPVLYHGSEVGLHRLDLLVAGFAKPTLETKRVVAPEQPHQDFLASWLP